MVLKKNVNTYMENLLKKNVNSSMKKVTFNICVLIFFLNTYVIFLFHTGNIKEGKNLRGDFARGTTGSCEGLCENYGEDFGTGRYICANGRDASAGTSLQRKTVRSKETYNGGETKHSAIFLS